MLVLRLGIKDLLYDWPVSTALMLTIVSGLAPLLLLFGLKIGVIGALRELLLEDPRNLEILLFSNSSLSLDWFDNLRNQQDISFLLPKTRSINTVIDLENERRQGLRHIEILPTAPGDPLLPPTTAAPTTPDTVLLSHAAAAQLQVSQGDPIMGLLHRRLADQDQRVAVELKVLDIVPERAVARPVMFSTLSFLEALEDFMDGYAVPVLGLQEGEPRPALRTVYASARLYVRTLEAVATVGDQLRAEGLDVRTRAEDIGRMQTLDRLLTRILLLIVAVAVIGGVLAFCTAIWIVIDRKRTRIALLRLLGLNDGAVMAFVLCQGLAVGVAAYAVAYLLFLGGAAALNHYGAVLFELFGDAGNRAPICRLQGQDVLVSAGLTVMLTAVSAFWGARHAKAIEPGECVREL